MDFRLMIFRIKFHQPLKNLSQLLFLCSVSGLSVYYMCAVCVWRGTFWNSLSLALSLSLSLLWCEIYSPSVQLTINARAIKEAELLDGRTEASYLFFDVVSR